MPVKNILLGCLVCLNLGFVQAQTKSDSGKSATQIVDEQYELRKKYPDNRPEKIRLKDFDSSGVVQDSLPIQPPKKLTRKKKCSWWKKASQR